jgi:hypothetical protein
VLPSFAGLLESVTRTFAVNEPDVVGVPEMIPVSALIDTPGGSPIADQVYGAVPPGVVWFTGETATPTELVCPPGLLTENEAELTLQSYWVLPAFQGLFESLAMTITVNKPDVVGVPEMIPVAGLIDTPGGSPVADQLNGAFPPSVVCFTGEIAAPTALVWAPGLITENEGEATTAGNWVLPDFAGLLESVALTTGWNVPVAVGVPEMVPVVASIDRPDGRPVADQV